MSTSADKGITEKDLTAQTTSTNTQEDVEEPKPATTDEIEAMIEEMRQKAINANKTKPRKSPEAITQQVEEVGKDIRGKAKKLEEADTV